MSIDAQATALSTPEPLNSLRETPLVMHRVWFSFAAGKDGIKNWYNIIREANALYGKTGWRGQPHVKRKLENHWKGDRVRVWFDVPDPKFGTWCSLKYAVVQTDLPDK